VLALGLALTSSLCWGVADFVGGVQSRRVPLLRVILVSQAVGLVAVVVVLAVRGVPPPALARLLPAIGGGLAGIAALSAFYRGLAIGTMSIVAPIAATGVAVPVIVGFAGGEHPQALQLVGIAAAVLGVVLVSRDAGVGPDARRVTRASIGLAIVAALGFGAFFVGLRASARADAMWALFAGRGAAVAALVGAARALRVPGILATTDLAPLAAMGLLDVTANGLYAIATRHGLLSIVAVAASLYPLATVLLARAVLGERVRRVQEAGIAAALVGVALIAAG
jgi:drug/metabolite transporter (DMT)-like permease